MRNLKKLLALVLAMAMAFSLMLSAGAVSYSDYPDKDSITADFDEAVQVLTGLKVMQGDERGFRPSDKITRAEAAAIIYRAVTGDVDDRQVDLYADYGTFTDVNSGDWFAGYVGYCQNAGLIKGTTPTTFNPYGQVTGYEALAMILRAVGYGKNNEFTGASWQVNVASMSRQLGVTRNVTSAHMETTLTMAAPREVVADLIFMTIATVPTVTYTPALAYNDKDSLIDGTYNLTLGQKVFGLCYSTGWNNIDRFGRPGYYWYKDGVRSGITNANTGKAYVVKENHPLYVNNANSTRIATIAAVPNYETTEQVRECDVAHALEDYGFGASETFRLYVNGDFNINTTDSNFVDPITDEYKIVATDTVTKVGGQGRVTEVYFEVESPWFTDLTEDVVMVDTFLAYVTGKTDAVLDKNNHVITPAKLDVVIYDGNLKTPNTPNSSTRVISKPSTSADNWDDYSVGDYILLNAYTDQNTPNDHVTASAGDLEKAAFETNKVIDNASHTLTAGGGAQNVWVLKKADVKQGKQTVVYWNQGKHNVDGTDYPDQMTLFLDKAGTNTNTTYNWYFDLYGNIIGIAEAKGSTYGVITSIYAAVSQGESDTTGGIKAMATVKYTDGTTGTVAIDKFLVSNFEDHTVSNDKVNGTYAGISTNWVAHPMSAATGHDWNGNQSDELAATAELRPRYDTVGNLPLTANEADPNFSSDLAYKTGFLYLAPSTVANNDAHFSSYADRDQYGILYKNLFEFVTASDDSVIAIEVAGTAQNTDLYAGNQNRVLGAESDKGRLIKSLGVLSMNYDSSNSALNRTDVRLDSNTKIIVRSNSVALKADGSGYEEVRAGTINTYTLATLPGDVELDWLAEADWVDENNDGIAEHVYVHGSVPGALTYGLFYYNGGAAQWNGTTGTIEGYLNGEAATVTFNSEAQFRTVQNSSNYNAHLFALQMSGGVVSSVMSGKNQKSTADGEVGPYLLHDYSSGGATNEIELIISTSGTSYGNNVRTAFTGVYNEFTLGTGGNNPYSGTTRAIYYRDTAGDPETADNTAGETNLSYNRSTRTITVSDDNNKNIVYWLAADATVVGEPEWLNTRACDVTIVFDSDKANALVATEVYVTPDPDWTPSPDPVGDTDNMQILQASYDNANQALTFTVFIKDNGSAVTWTNSNDTVTLTLKDQRTNLTVVNGVVTPQANGVIGSGVAATGGHQYTVTVPAGGLSLDNSNLYSGTLTLVDADGTVVTSAAGDTYVDNFTNLSIF